MERSTHRKRKRDSIAEKAFTLKSIQYMYVPWGLAERIKCRHFPKLFLGVAESAAARASETDTRELVEWRNSQHDDAFDSDLISQRERLEERTRTKVAAFLTGSSGGLSPSP